MKIKHHAIFKNLDANIINWNQLRNDSEEEYYYISKSKSEYIKTCNKNKNNELIQDIKAQLKINNISNIFSLGSGRSCLEYHLGLENFSVTISDITDSIKTLKKFNLFKNTYKMNFFESIKKITTSKTAILMGRIDTELTDEMLRELFKTINSKKIQYIIFIPAQKLTFKSLLIELYIRLKSFLLKEKLVFCGYTRSNKLFNSFWGEFYNSQQFVNFYLLIRK